MKRHLENFAIIVVILVIIFAGFLLVYLYFQDVNEKEMNFLSIEPQISEETNMVSGEQTSEIASTDSSVDGNYLSDAMGQNQDTVAWLLLPDADISYPVVQAQDNEYYLNHKFNKKKSKIGNPFLDYRCESDFSGFNSIIYGHNIKGNKVFANLNKYKDKKFFKSASKGTLITANRIYNVNVFAVMVIPNDGFIFETVFMTDHDRTSFLSSLKSNAMFYEEPKVDLEERGVVTLSTCSYEYKDARTVVIGYLTER